MCIERKDTCYGDILTPFLISKKTCFRCAEEFNKSGLRKYGPGGSDSF